VDKHIVYYSANKKMQSKALKEKLSKQTKTINRIESGSNKTLTKPLNINISLTTPKFILRIIIKSVPISQNEFLVNSSCLFMTR
jgi:hypothetical protein